MESFTFQTLDVTISNESLQMIVTHPLFWLVYRSLFIL